MAPDWSVDRPKVQFDLLREAEKEYVKNTGDKIEYWQRRMMARFTRNLASISNDLMAGVFDLTVAARSVVDDNYAYEVWQMANRYPAQKPSSDLMETVNLSSQEIWFNTKKLRLRRRLPRPKQRLVPRGLKERKKEKFEGEVGATVVIFDEDPEDRYKYLTTWLGEHQNESDMAFYSTHPFQHLVGPGIGRAEYGGFLMALPPRRMLDVWTDPDYEFAQNKPERLLMAALDYSKQRFVVYVASKPPRSIFRSIAAHLNRRIIYIPIGALNPTKLKKLRVVHVLDSYERRDEAKDYIW